ncbi:MAG: hypothetical protein LBS89_08795 [Zoogloeaceae bacterium]|nr:hypothetical protein [Zoogloeaceae bacterium]
MTPCRRFSLTFLFVLPFLFACANKSPAPRADSKVTPPAEFRVHPGLLGQPVPPELQPVVEDPVEVAPEPALTTPPDRAADAARPPTLEGAPSGPEQRLLKR